MVTFCLKLFFFLIVNVAKKSYNFKETRTKTSIRYAKENDREKREKERGRKKGRRRDIVE